jgi:hypothetical protein
MTTAAISPERGANQELSLQLRPFNNGLLLGNLGVAQKAISSSQFASSELRTWDVRSRGRTWC